MKQVLKTCLSLGEGGCEQSEQTEGGNKAVSPFSRLRRQFPQGEPRINANGSVPT